MIFDSYPLPIAGIVPTSTCDWEGKIVTTVFLQGCPLRCVFCHNPELISRRSTSLTQEDFQCNWSEFLLTLEKRKNIIDGVVFSGGEPLLHPNVVQVAAHIRESYPNLLLGYHTSGVFPKRVGDLVERNLVDWVGLDIKASPVNYKGVANFSNFAKVRQTLEILSNSEVGTEIRTTVHQNFFKREDVIGILDLLQEYGYEEWVIQLLREEGTQKEWSSVSQELLGLIKGRAKTRTVSVKIR